MGGEGEVYIERMKSNDNIFSEIMIDIRLSELWSKSNQGPFSRYLIPNGSIHLSKCVELGKEIQKIGGVISQGT